MPPPDPPPGAGPDDGGPLPAGAFSAWLAGLEAALRGERASDVACGTCTACCASGQFVPVEPDEADALAHIPRALRFPAPGRPPGHVVLGYDEHGRCPMLGERGCTIYEHRPRACRTYDCRVFPAAGLDVGEGEGKEGIARRARRWRFDHPTPADRADHEAVRAAARWIGGHGADLPPEVAPVTTTQLAVRAVQAHRAFLGGQPTADEVRVALTGRPGLGGARPEARVSRRSAPRG